MKLATQKELDKLDIFPLPDSLFLSILGAEEDKNERVVLVVNLKSIILNTKPFSRLFWEILLCLSWCGSSQLMIFCWVEHFFFGEEGYQTHWLGLWRRAIIAANNEDKLLNHPKLYSFHNNICIIRSNNESMTFGRASGLLNLKSPYHDSRRCS